MIFDKKNITITSKNLYDKEKHYNHKQKCAMIFNVRYPFDAS